MSAVTVEIMRLPHGEGLPLPAYQTAHAAGLDLVAAVPEDAPLTLAPGARALVPTGIAMALPAGFEGQVRPRSGLAVNHGLSVLNAPGTVDADYRGEVRVLLINLGREFGRYRPRNADRAARGRARHTRGYVGGCDTDVDGTRMRRIRFYRKLRKISYDLI